MEAVPEAVTFCAALLAQARATLVRSGVETAPLDAELLLAHACGVSRAEVLCGALVASRSELERFYRMLARRARREPLAYIVGRKEFFSLEFEVTRDVLVPRPETEALVAAALEIADRTSRGRAGTRVLDIGTGSGAVAIAIARNAPNCVVLGTDVSAAALQVARRNARRLGCGARVEFETADLFPRASECFDLIVSNPPYVPTDAIGTLAPEVGEYEPRLALDGGSDGLDFYRRIASSVTSNLAPAGAVMVEIGMDQGACVEAIFRQAGFTRIEKSADLAGVERVITAARAV